MYRRKTYIHVAEPRFAQNLQALGFEVDLNGQVLTAKGEHLDARLHRTLRLHTIHWEGIRGGVRKFVAQAAAGFGVRPLYLCGHDGRTMSEEALDCSQPTLSILTSSLEDLKSKKTVVVIVGEHTEDPNVFSHHEAMHQSGIHNASILKILDQLSRWKTRGKDLTEACSEDAGHCGMQDDNTPGVVVLNPGQLIYSYEDRKTYTVRSWLARPLQAGQQDTYSIDPKYNFVPGHQDARQHVKTCFDYIIPELIACNASICMIGIGDGAGNMLTVLDDLLTKESKHIIAEQLSAIFLIQPTHDPDELTSTVLEKHLRQCGRSFVLSEEPRLTLLQGPTDAPDETQANEDKHTPVNPIVHCDDDQPAWPDAELPGSWSNHLAAAQKQDSHEYDYAKDKVSCATYSAGPEILHVNAILPSIMPHLLDVLHGWPDGKEEAALM